MDKKDILKYVLIYVVVAWFVNYFFLKKRVVDDNRGQVVLLQDNVITSQKPLMLDLSSFNSVISKKIIVSDDKNIVKDNSLFLENDTGIFEFNTYTGGPISYNYIHPITKKNMSVFNYHELSFLENIPPLTLLIDDVAIFDYDLELNEVLDKQRKVVFSKKYIGHSIIKKIFTIKDNSIGVNIIIENKNNIAIKSVKLVNQEMVLVEKDENQGVFNYNVDDQITKFSINNEVSLLNSVVLKPEMVGMQSTYFAQSMLKTVDFDRAYFDSFAINDKKSIRLFIEKCYSSSLGDIDLKFEWYCGPKINNVLNQVDDRLSLIMEYGYLAKISNILFSIVFYFTSLLGNLGLALILFTLICKLLILPFASYIKSSNRSSKEFQQKLEYVKAKYHDNPQKKSEEEMALFKQYGIFPGFVARLPQIFNILIMISLPSFLKQSILLYKVPLGLWMTDASLPDKYYVLPILFFIFIYLQINNSKLTPMMKIAIIIFSVIFLYAFSYFSSGMQLFVVTGLIMGYIENKLLGVN